MNPVTPGVFVLGGATCSGKTALAIELAERFDAEIVGADSRQIYRGMAIGTAAPTAAECARVPHHLVEFLDPFERYSAARFASDALAAIADISARGKHAIVAGGTGFYIRALCGDVTLSPAFDAPLRARLAREARVHPPEVLHAWLHARDPSRASVVAPTDAYRIVRALEIALAESAKPGTPGASGAAQTSLRSSSIPAFKVVLSAADDELERRIEARVDAMLAAGLVAEAERVGSGAVAADAVGYPQALAFLAGASTGPELRASLIRATRRYAKRQRTWFRSEPHVRLLRAGEISDAVRATLGW